jgi:hypothetical protein
LILLRRFPLGVEVNIVSIVLIWMMQMDDDEPSWWIIVPIVGTVVAIAFITREIVIAVRRRRASAASVHAPVSASLIQPPSHLTGERKVLDIHAAGKKLRSLQRKITELEAAGLDAERSRAAAALCEKYLTETEDALRAGVGADVRAVLRNGVERARAWHKKYLLEWTRAEAQNLMQEAQRRARLSDKIETAGRALDVINEALKSYPQEFELLASADAVRDLIASVKIGHWVELAERAAFRGRYARALARYQDALFYLSRVEMSDAARSGAEARLNREIEMLRARIASEKVEQSASAASLREEGQMGGHIVPDANFSIGREKE